MNFTDTAIESVKNAIKDMEVSKGSNGLPIVSNAPKAQQTTVAQKKPNKEKENELKLPEYASTEEALISNAFSNIFSNDSSDVNSNDKAQENNESQLDPSFESTTYDYDPTLPGASMEGSFMSRLFDGPDREKKIREGQDAIDSVTGDTFFDSDGNFNMKGGLFSRQRISSNSELDIYNRIHEQNKNKTAEDLKIANEVKDLYKDSAVDFWDIDLGDGQNEEGQYLLGAEYINQRNNGIPGRPVEDIDPYAIYSKQDELDNYGYAPYIPNEVAWQNFNASAGLNNISNFWNNTIGNFRRDNVDYVVNYADKALSGKSFDQALKKNYKDIVNFKNEYEEDSDKFLTAEPTDDNSSPMIRTYRLVDKNGETIDMKREGYTDGSTLGIEFADGTSWSFADGTILEGYEKATNDDLNNPNAKIVGYLNAPEMTIKTDQGETVIDALDAIDIAQNKDQISDYGWGYWGKSDANPFEQGTAESFWPWIIDGALSTIPYFHPSMSVPLAMANAGRTASGVVGRDDATGEYTLVPEDSTMVDLATMAGAQMAMPATEMLLGGIGKGVLNQFLPEFKYGLANAVVRAGGEGVEEIPSGIVEEIAAYGAPKAFSNDLTDENGNIVYDSNGQAVRDKNTSLEERTKAFAMGIPESFVAGAAIGTGIEGARYLSPRTLGPLNDLATLQEARQDKKKGMKSYKVVRPNDVHIEMSEEDVKRLYGEDK